VTKFNGALLNMLREADVQETLAREGIERAGTTPEQFGAFIRSEIAKWTKVAQDTGVQLD
jgi:tripartite-type tricarboxylate transporter receptor subunit TctC